MLITYYFIMPLMSNISYLTILGAGLLVVMTTELNIHPSTSVFASVDQSALESVDLHLEECVKEL
jgi:hypothetical protein